MVTLKNKILALLYETQNSWDTGLPELYQPESFVYNSFARRYKKSSLRQRLWEMVCRGELKKVVRDGQKLLVLTAKGKEAVCQQIPFYRHPPQWGGAWFLLAIDLKKVPPRLRLLGQKRLSWAGLGEWSSSLWLTPFPIEAEIKTFLEEAGLAERAIGWEAARLFGLEAKDVAERAWPRLAGLNQMYADLVKEWAEGQTNYGQNLELIKKIAASLQERYVTLVCSDPGLPEALLPSNWPGRLARKLLPEWSKVVY